MNDKNVISDVISNAPLDLASINSSVGHNVSGCYLIFCDKTEKYYVGSSIDCRSRKYAHFREISRGYSLNENMASDVKKYGKSAFHFFIVEECHVSELEDIERKWFNIIGVDRLYNATPGIIRTHKSKVEIEHKNNMGANTEQQTIEQLCKVYGKSLDTVRVQFARTLKDRGRTFSRTYVPTAEERVILKLSDNAGRLPVVRTTKKEVVASQATRRGVVAKVSPPALSAKSGNARRFILYLLMAIPAAASIQNIQGVTFDITGHLFASILLTGLFSAAPFLFVLAGVRNAPTRVLVGFMVLYEAFCNLTRIYGGLTGFGKGGFPTRFLGLVTDIFNTGTHQTGVFLAIIMAILAASTFYAAYFELTKK